MFGELPNPEEYAKFNARVREHSMVHEGMRTDQRLSAGRAPDGMLVGLVGSLSTFYHDSLSITLSTVLNPRFA